jgi:hypothetical protein
MTRDLILWSAILAALALVGVLLAIVRIGGRRND